MVNILLYLAIRLRQTDGTPVTNFQTSSKPSCSAHAAYATWLRLRSWVFGSSVDQSSTPSLWLRDGTNLLCDVFAGNVLEDVVDVHLNKQTNKQTHPNSSHLHLQLHLNL
jgi:hypothetical protein